MRTVSRPSVESDEKGGRIDQGHLPDDGRPARVSRPLQTKEGQATGQGQRRPTLEPVMRVLVGKTASFIKVALTFVHSLHRLLIKGVDMSLSPTMASMA